jgi:hypothetical protein
MFLFFSFWPFVWHIQQSPQNESAFGANTKCFAEATIFCCKAQMISQHVVTDPDVGHGLHLQSAIIELPHLFALFRRGPSHLLVSLCQQHQGVVILCLLSLMYEILFLQVILVHLNLHLNQKIMFVEQQRINVDHLEILTFWIEY